MSDPGRPSYHYTSGGWMNDVVPYWDGRRLHVFFNHHKEPRWGRFRWGHAVSGDLVGWATAPFAIVPTRGGPDEGGVWTGSVVDTPDGPAALYTGVADFEPFTQVQCLARSAPAPGSGVGVGVGAEVWDKHPGPVLTAPPEGFGECWRDPYAWRDGDRWRMLVGSAVAGEKVAAVLAYSSPDLEAWSFDGPLYVDRAGELGPEAECPELFPLGDRHVLVTSSGTTKALVGTLARSGDGVTFEPDGPAVAFDPAASYAARSVDVGGRRVQLAWVRDARPRDEWGAGGWVGALSLPREVSLSPGGRLRVSPVPELVALRAERVHAGPVAAGPGPAGLVPGCAGPALELDVTLAPAGAGGGAAELVVGCDAAGAGGLAIGVDRAAGTIAGHDLGPVRTGEPLRLHVFVDASVVEVFALGRVVTLRCHDVVADGRVALRGPGAAGAEVAAWRLAPPPGSHPVGTPGVVTAIA